MKTVVITGSARGLGYELAKYFANKYNLDSSVVINNLNNIISPKDFNETPHLFALKKNTDGSLSCNSNH